MPFIKNVLESVSEWKETISHCPVLWTTVCDLETNKSYLSSPLCCMLLKQFFFIHHLSFQLLIGWSFHSLKML